MDEKRTNSIRALTDLLAEMTERVVKLEADLADAESRAADWFQSWRDKNTENEQLAGDLEKEIEEHVKTKKILQGLLDDIKEGELTYGTNE